MAPPQTASGGAPGNRVYLYGRNAGGTDAWGLLKEVPYPLAAGGFGPSLRATENVRKDMDQIRAFYGDKTAKYPDRFVEPRLKEEL